MRTDSFLKPCRLPISQRQPKTEKKTISGKNVKTDLFPIFNFTPIEKSLRPINEGSHTQKATLIRTTVYKTINQLHSSLI